MSDMPISDLVRDLPRECPHGLAFRNMQLPAGGWSGGVSECACCYGTFGYVDSAAWGAKITVTNTWTPKDRCATCGGKYVKYDSRGVSSAKEGAPK